jgi:hypothetical protein
MLSSRWSTAPKCLIVSALGRRGDSGILVALRVSAFLQALHDHEEGGHEEQPSGALSPIMIAGAPRVHLEKASPGRTGVILGTARAFVACSKS